MNFLSDPRNRPVLVGGVLALAAGVGVALVLVMGHRGEATAPAPASQGGLVIDTGQAADEQVDPALPLRCFVDGQFVAELTLAECAKRNGVATGALDVGVDDSGQLAAAEQAGPMLTPLPPKAPPRPKAAPTPAPPPPAAPTATATSSGPTPAGPCWRHTDGGWTQLPSELTLNGCVQALFAGRCERSGGASYGRWMQQTLRLVPGKVEVSGDNRKFRALAEQSAGCAIAPVG